MKIAVYVLFALSAGCVGPSLFVDKAGEGNGTVTSDPLGIDCGDACGMLATGPITLVATPDDASMFIGWDGACSGSEPCTVNVDETTQVVAIFEPTFHSLVIEKPVNGRVIGGGVIDCGDDCDEFVRHGTKLSLKALPDPGYSLGVWSDTTCTSDTCPIEVDAPRSLTVTFERNKTLSVSVVGNGTVTSETGIIFCGSQCGAVFPPYASVRLTATPQPGYELESWSGACSGSSWECQLTMHDSLHVTATFVPQRCNITVTSDEHSMLFNTRLQQWGARICIADGVTITGPVIVAADQVSIRSATVGGSSPPRIVNPMGDAIDTTGNGLLLDGLDIESSGSSDLRAAIRGRGGSITIRNSTVRCNSHNCYIINSQLGTSISISDSTLLGGVASSTFSYGVYGYYSGPIVITNSTVTSYGAALSFTKTIMTVTESELASIHPYVPNSDVGVIDVVTGSTLELTSSTVRTSGFDLIDAYVQTGFDPPTLYVNDTMFRRAAGTPAGSFSPLRTNRNDIPFHATLPNTFCNEGTSTTDGALALPLIGGAGITSPPSTFNSVTHTGPGNCP